MSLRILIAISLMQIPLAILVGRFIKFKASLSRVPRGPLRLFKRLQTSNSREVSMRSILVGLLAVSAIAIVTPVVPASAQVTVDTPIGGVSVGHRHHYRDYDSPRYRGYARYGGCRTVTVTRDDGSFKRIRRCG